MVMYCCMYLGGLRRKESWNSRGGGVRVGYDEKGLLCSNTYTFAPILLLVFSVV